VRSRLDTFVMAYHAAESMVRMFIALITGAGPMQSPLLALLQNRADPPNKKSVGVLTTMTPESLNECTDWVFLPVELQATLTGEMAPMVTMIQTYCRRWVRHLARFVLDFERACNSA
jgi:hypothetical protein